MSALVDTFFDWLLAIYIAVILIWLLSPLRVATSLAQLLHRRGHTARAIAVMRLYLRWRPHVIRGWHALAWYVALADAPSELDRRSRQIEVLQEGYALNPESEKLCGDLAEALAREGKESEAYALLSEFHARQDSFPVLVELALLAWDAGNRDEVLRLTARALPVLDPEKHAYEAFKLAHALVAFGQRDAAEDLLLQVEPHSWIPGVHYLLALLIEDKDPVEARRQLAAARFNCHVDRTVLADAFDDLRDQLERWA